MLDLDIKSFFETIDHELLMRAVTKHTTIPWVLLYIKRWLTAPAQLADGTVAERIAGTPQGGVISPLLANLFLHYGFDRWMSRNFPDIPFERYADDLICHCRSEDQAKHLKEAITQRFLACRLELHPQKTLIAYCKDGRRKGKHSDIQFSFLGFSFRPRRVKGKNGGLFVGFTPAISPKAALSIRSKMRTWYLHQRSDLSFDELARWVNPSLRGWINYYGAFYRSALQRVLRDLDDTLIRWAMRKFKDLHRRPGRAREWLAGVKRRQPATLRALDSC